MPAEGRHVEVGSAADAVGSARFVRIATHPDGDAVAAAGLLARALATVGVPYQASTADTVEERRRRLETDEPTREDVAIVLGDEVDEAVAFAGLDRPVSVAAYDLASDLGTDPDPLTALAGAVAAGSDPGAGETERLLEAADGRVERTDGVAIPTADPVDGLAHSTRVHAPWSGDVDATREALSAVETDDARSLASAVALDAVTAANATDRTADAVAAGLRPYATPDAPFETVGGYADVLAATARTDPGIGVALAGGHDVREAALDAWRTHGRQVHDALATATTSRYDGVFVLEVDDAPVDSVARLALAYRSPEPAVLVLGDEAAAIETVEDRALAEPIEGLACELDAAHDAGRRRGLFRVDPGTDDRTIVDATKRALEP